MSHQPEQEVPIEIMYYGYGLTRNSRLMCNIKYNNEKGKICGKFNITAATDEDYYAFRDVLDSDDLRFRRVKIHVIADEQIKRERESTLTEIARKHNNSISSRPSQNPSSQNHSPQTHSPQNPS